MGTYLAKPVIRKEREDGVGPDNVRYGVAAMQGWRLCQEDAHLALPHFDKARKLGLFAVFDGHCGGVVSKLVAKWLPDELRSLASFKAGDYPRALREVFLALDSRLDSTAGRKAVKVEGIQVRSELVQGFHVEGELSEADVERGLLELCADNPDEMGCTAVVALLEYGCRALKSPSCLHVANCGDSRCVLWDTRGRSIAMSKDHKPTHKIERSRVEAEGGWVTSEGRIEGNLNLSRALADFEYKRTRKHRPPEKQMISGVPDVRSRLLRRTDRFLMLGCDGVWETRKGSQKTVDVVRRCLPKGRRGQLSAGLGRFLNDTLAKDTSSGLGMDNMTVVLVELPAIVAISKKEGRRPRQNAKGVRQTILKRPAAKRK